jgi:very-short-patch-repair endonuclease
VAYQDLGQGLPVIPTDDSGRLEWLLFHQDDVISWGQARHFFSESALRHRARAGHWRQVHPRVYVTHSGPVSREQRLWVAVLAAGRGAVLAGGTALAEYGLHRYEEPGVHLLLPARRQPRRVPPGVIVHRTTVLPRADVHRMALPPRTMPARSVVDAAQWAGSDDDARGLVAAAFQRRIVTLDEMTAVLDRLPRARRRAVIASAAADAAGGSHSLAELDYLRLNRRYRLPEPTRQVWRRDASGRSRYLDVYYEKYHLHVEIDGEQHTDARQRWADMKRQNEVWIAGDRVLRFPAWLVRARPDEVFAQIRAALIAGGYSQ